jgi:very-short-patch-repair endonuclease
MKRHRLIHNVQSSNDRRKELRQHLTPAEATLWRYLKNSQLCDHKFRRQHSIGPFFVDFYCAEKRLAIELDGAGHRSEFGAERDLERTEFLKRFNVRVLRIENRLVFDDIDGVLGLIQDELDGGVE